MEEGYVPAAMTDDLSNSITDQEVQTFVRAFIRGCYRDRALIGQEQGFAFMRAVLRRIVREQVTAIESLGGLGDWSHENLSKLLSDAAELELGQLAIASAEIFADEMLKHGPMPGPTTASSPDSEPSN